MNRHKPLYSLFFFSLIVNPQLFSFEQGDVLPEHQYDPAYNAPSQVMLQNDRAADFFIDASFLYYYTEEEGLDLATSAAIAQVGGQFSIVATENSKTSFQEFKYSPGFQVGFGARWCEWTLAGEYTWIRQTTHTHSKAPDSDLANAIGVYVLDNWFIQTSPSGQSISATSLNSKWHLGIDLADLMLSRPYYQGRFLSIAPFFGIRAAWIRQNIKIGIHVPTQIIANQVSSETLSRNSSNSWALGPRAGLEANCLLGNGFRLQGDLAASLLFTQYTHVRHKEIVVSVTAIPDILKADYDDYNCVRAIGELGVGIGWGSYFNCQRYHFDLSAMYNFMVFFNQNMMRQLLDAQIAGTGASAGNLNLHGLSITASFDF